ncbi:aminotransferase class V-fold PLP-dependent enzyme [Rhodobacteraceae bacterium 2376]|uniref:Aminotransferase class V-fold PLP-dependent enzyme n=1 Tax=Rhabdonatronobacter sediminivivens TaxID=2743469 RepID=A0A7Z0HWW7_9RHOB|nr:aminotransferase class V-fold PLP-dependent enzyme [Rhabdonatronobacter sediminivivens]NYS23820.1 aminotransferase class V-fold PLP-dependent enzyme [Rhabdonatronobacter sediminivivens]
MKTGLSHLYIPGPTNLPEDVRRALAVPMQDHRAPEFAALVTPLLQDLKPVFGTTEGTILLYPGSGTGAWEAAIANTLNPGDKVLMARHGMFSTLWAEMATRLGLQVELVDVPWGAPCPVETFARILADDSEHSIRAVFVTQNETATGVASDVEAVRAEMDACGHDALLFVDGVSSVASVPFEMDAWRVDLAIAGSQKGLMCPAGLGVLALSPRALALAETNTMPRAYFHLGDMANAHAAGSFPYTPPAPILHGLRAALDRLNAEGLDNVYARHVRLARGVRAAVEAWGLRCVAESPACASNTVTAIYTPDGVDAREVIAIARDQFNCYFGAGLGPLAGRAFRIGHLGDLNEGMCLSALSIAEMALNAAGARIPYGSGVAAAQQVYAPAPGQSARPAIAAE